MKIVQRVEDVDGKSLYCIRFHDNTYMFAHGWFLLGEAALAIVFRNSWNWADMKVIYLESEEEKIEYENRLKLIYKMSK